MIIDTGDLAALDETDLWEAARKINYELDRRGSAFVETDVTHAHPDAVALVCDVEDNDDGCRTAAPGGVLLADGRTAPLTQALYLETCDDVADLAGVDGAIVKTTDRDGDDLWLVTFSTYPPGGVR